VQIVYFLPFSPDELLQLVRQDLARWQEKAKKRHGLDLSWSEEVPALIARGYDVHYGARSLKYELDRQVINKLAQAWEQGDIIRQSKVRVDVAQDTNQVTLYIDKPDPKAGGGLFGLLNR
jgi:ATP-dependent Clp protease ATP-binding subunit ClpB